MTSDRCTGAGSCAAWRPGPARRWRRDGRRSTGSWPARTRHPTTSQSEGLTVPDDCTHHVVDADDGGRIHVIERGQGPPVVLLHGFMLSSALWAHQLRDLAEHHRVIAPDLRGHGSSVAGAAGFSTDRRHRSRRRAARRCSHGRGPTGLSGGAPHGHGRPGRARRARRRARRSWWGTRWVAWWPSSSPTTPPPPELQRRMAGLALVSTTAGPFARVPGLRGDGAPGRARLGTRHGPGRPVGGAHPGVARTCAGGSPGSASGPTHRRPRSASSRDCTWRRRRARWPTCSRPWRSSTCRNGSGPSTSPCSSWWASHDRLTPPRHAQRTAAALARSELVELPRCGHMPMIERRREFTRLIEEFAAKIG